MRIRLDPQHASKVHSTRAELDKATAMAKARPGDQTAEAARVQVIYVCYSSIFVYFMRFVACLARRVVVMYMPGPCTRCADAPAGQCIMNACAAQSPSRAASASCTMGFCDHVCDDSAAGCAHASNWSTDCALLLCLLQAWSACLRATGPAKVKEAMAFVGSLLEAAAAADETESSDDEADDSTPAASRNGSSSSYGRRGAAPQSQSKRAKTDGSADGNKANGEEEGEGSGSSRKRVKKVLVFAHHSGVLDDVQAWLHQQHVGCMRIDGSTPPAQRQQAVELFQVRYDSVLLVYALREASQVMHCWSPCWQPSGNGCIYFYLFLFLVSKLHQNNGLGMDMHSCVCVHGLTRCTQILNVSSSSSVCIMCWGLESLSSAIQPPPQ